MENEAKTDPSGLAPPSLPAGVYAVPNEVLQHILDDLRGIHGEIHEMRVEILAQLTDLTLEVLPRLQTLEEQSIKGFPVCRYHHQNGRP